MDVYRCAARACRCLASSHQTLSFGVVLWEMLEGKLPFIDLTWDSEVAQRVLRGERCVHCQCVFTNEGVLVRLHQRRVEGQNCATVARTLTITKANNPELLRRGHLRIDRVVLGRGGRHTPIDGNGGWHATATQRTFRGRQLFRHPLMNVSHAISAV